jgi:hypothetical protein
MGWCKDAIRRDDAAIGEKRRTNVKEGLEDGRKINSQISHLGDIVFARR